MNDDTSVAPAPASTREVLGPIAYFVGEYRRTYAVLLVVSIAAAIAGGIVLAALYPLMTLVLGGSLSGGGLVLQTLATWIGAIPEDRRVPAALALFLAAVLADAGLKILREWLSAHASTLVSLDVKRRLFQRFLDAPYSYYVAQRPGSLNYLLGSAASYLSSAMLITAGIAALALTAVANVLLLLSVDRVLTFGILVLGFIFFLVNRYGILGTLVGAGRARVQSALAEAGLATEIAAGAKEIKVAQVGDRWLRRFMEQAETYRRQLVNDLVLSATPGIVMELTVMVAIGLGAVTLRALAPEMLQSALPVLAVYALGVRQLLSVLSQISRQSLRLPGMTGDLRLVRSTLTEPHEPVRSGDRPMPAWQRISFVGVTTRYGSRQERALDGVDLDIDRGSFLGIVGPSGAGKSTVLHLLLRLFDPTEGALRLDRSDLADVDVRAWRSRMGYVDQDGFIFDGTVRENIAFGRDSDDAEIERAATAAHADEFITRLPDTYATRVGGRGLTLSAGQRQRILIARALVRMPEMLLMDEGTGALDARSEQAVQSALELLRGRCTIVVVAHRLVTVANADAIVVLDRGRVVDSGRPEALRDRPGLYRDLWRMQELQHASS